MTVARLSEDDAFRWLRTRAMQTRSTLADVAHIVLGIVPDGAQAADGASATPRAGRGPRRACSSTWSMNRASSCAWPITAGRNRARTADVEGAAAAGATVLRPVKDEFRATAPG
jgi:hypothetical protein